MYTSTLAIFIEIHTIIEKQKNVKFIIFENSLSTINDEQNIFQLNEIAKKLQNKLNNIIGINLINYIQNKGKYKAFMWIPGRIDIEGNELTNEKAIIAIIYNEISTINEVRYDDIKKIYHH